MITFLAPKINQPPTFATFKVPLTFNKFDLRDYLLHAYKTPVLAVRSQLRQQSVRRSKIHGRIYRPPPIKTMTVQLKQPFVWPRVPTDITPWKKPAMAKAQAMEKQNYVDQARTAKTGYMRLRDEKKQTIERKDMKMEAKRLLKEGGWTNNRELDPRFSESDKAKKT
jgi:large subunit ribosomal protein L23